LVYLKNSIDETMYFLRENGAFSLLEDRVLPFSALTVEGRSLGQAKARTISIFSQPVSSSSPGSSHLSALTQLHPTRGHLLPCLGKTPPPSYTLKIIKAKIVKNGRRVQFKPNLQLFMHLVESTANVD